MNTPSGDGADEWPAGREADASSAYSSRLRLEFDDGSVVVDPSPEEIRALGAGVESREAVVQQVVGVVRVWHGDEGWGVIDAPEMPGGCWAHFSVVEVPGYRELRAGQQVLLDSEAAHQDGYAFRATRVELLAEGRPGA